jgi:hypothetical protein
MLAVLIASIRSTLLTILMTGKVPDSSYRDRHFMTDTDRLQKLLSSQQLGYKHDFP